MTARLPIVGGDAGNWGTILNTFLQVSHAADGTLNSGVVAATQANLPSLAGGMLLSGTFSARPTASSSNSGFFYVATDINGGTLYQSSGSAWSQIAAGSTQAPTGSVSGGDLTGTYPGPTIAKIQGATISGSPSSGTAVVATSGTAAAWTAIATSFNGRTGAISPTSGDYTAAQVTNAADKSSALIQAFIGALSSGKSIVAAVVALTDGATISVDVSQGNHFRVVIAGNRTLANPTNPVDGQKITFEIIQDATGSRTISFGTAYAFSTDIPQPTLTTTANKRDFLGFVYNATTSLWYLLAVVHGF